MNRWTIRRHTNAWPLFQEPRTCSSPGRPPHCGAPGHVRGHAGGVGPRVVAGLAACLVVVMGGGVGYAEDTSKGSAQQTGRTGPQVTYYSPGQFTGYATNLSSFVVRFGLPIRGVHAGDLTVNGSPATHVTGSGVGPYVFTDYASPAPGAVHIVLAAGTITRDSADAPPFEGAAWSVRLLEPQADEDGDGLSNEEELTKYSDPTKTDTDGDGLPDPYELSHHACLTVFVNEALPQDNYGVVIEGTDDADDDGVSNVEEYRRGTDPCASDR